MRKKHFSSFKCLLLLVSPAFGGVLSGCKTSDTDSDGTGIFEKISVSEAYNLIQNNAINSNFAILGVHTAEEFNSGHIEGAVNIDLYTGDFESQFDMLNKDEVYLVYCRNDNRSGQALGKIEGLGFCEACDMSGGINAWNGAGYPMVQ